MQATVSKSKRERKAIKKELLRQERFKNFLWLLKELEKEGKIKFDPTTFDGRIEIQNITYIAKFFGIDLGYKYDYYIRGPYSKELAEDYFLLARILGLRNPVRELIEKMERDDNEKD